MATPAQIPVLSLTPLPAPSELAESLEEYGFLQLAQPKPELLDLAGRMFSASKRFFEEESVEEKQRCKRVHPVNSGWVGQGVEKLDVKGADDLKEAFNITAFKDTPKQSLPDLLAQETQLIADFIAACHSLCMDLLEGMALSLNLPKEYFTERHASHLPAATTLRLLYYPETKQQDVPLIRAGAHTDYGSLTLLFQQSASGLQVLLPEKDAAQGSKWLDVPASPDRVLVNVADLMEAWTGGRWPSTVHRVVVPPSVSHVGPRLSIAYFLQPADEVKLHRIGGVAGEGNRGRKFEEGTTSAEWLAARLKATYETKA